MRTFFFYSKYLIAIRLFIVPGKHFYLPIVEIMLLKSIIGKGSCWVQKISFVRNCMDTHNISIVIVIAVVMGVSVVSDDHWLQMEVEMRFQDLFSKI